LAILVWLFGAKPSPLLIDGGAEKLNGDPTDRPHSKIWYNYYCNLREKAYKSNID